jgi:thiol-disulfide isomerase/thioredoxin
MSVENMNDPVAANPPRSNRSFWLVGFIALVAVALGVYLIASEPRKPTELTQSVSNLRHLAKGPMAAFVVKSATDPTANIVFKDESGADTSLEKWRGRVVLLNLWATWCAPCRKEMPELDALQQKLGSPDFEVVALSLDRQGAETARKFLNETKATNLKLYVDATAKALESLRAPGLPTTILFDREGREVGRLAGAADWASPEAIALVESVIAGK